jgi:hypothetical protein
MNKVTINLLLDAAKAMTGSDYRTAKNIHTTRFAVSDWRTGKKKMPVADVALVAKEAGLDAEEWAARSIAALHEGTPKGECLKEALKKASGRTGEVIAMSGVPVKPGLYFIRCINCIRTKLRNAGGLRFATWGVPHTPNSLTPG